ncbi:MAG: hypothetical protein ACLFRP_01760 [Puniceicoccaceae bacterium]
MASFSPTRTGGLCGPEPELGCHHSDESLEDSANAAYFAVLARWGACEIRNHWVRDSRMFENRTRIRDRNINSNLAIPRCCLLAMEASLPSHLSWPPGIETAWCDHAFACQHNANHRLK